MLDTLSELRQKGLISLADYYFAKFINDKQQGLGYSETQQALAVLLAALCHHAYLKGDSCILLEPKLAKNEFGLAYNLPHFSIEQWQTMLATHVAFTTEPTQTAAPFVLKGNRLYLYRAWQDEQYVADYIKSAVKTSQIIAPAKKIRTILDKYFKLDQTAIDWQKVAVATALSQSFCLIAGGPGTGKTYSVASLLAALHQLRVEQHLSPLRIRLAAPTGKAAARLKESINQNLENLALADNIREAINTESETIHRLLGVRPFDDEVRFNEKNPLPLDVLIVDEASMIDLTMMAKLLRALPKQARLVLLGDNAQLASVEAGAILGELGAFFEQDYSPDFALQLQTMTGQNVPFSQDSKPIRQSLALLQKSRRFTDESALDRIAKAIKGNKPNESWAELNSGKDVSLVEFTPPETEQEQAIYRQQYFQHILQTAAQHYQHYLQRLNKQEKLTNDDLKVIFTAFNAVRFLTALRVGDFGVVNLNTQIAEALRQQKLLSFNHCRDWFIGKPIMVTENDVNVGLFNGDIGIYLEKNWVYFESGSEFKRVSINRVPAYEMAFAMTIHKSQGSEFKHTFVVLPPEKSPILSRELLYTAVTRAKPELTVFTSEAIWKTAVGNPIKRQSGLRDLFSEIE